MSERNAVISAALQGTHWAQWPQFAISEDASSRRYFRACGPKEQTVIVVDAPPEKEDYRRFLDVAALLSDHGLTVPKALFQDHGAGVFVVSDLGEKTLAASDPKLSPKAADAILDLLVEVQNISAPHLPKMEAKTAAKMLDPLFDSYGATGKEDLKDELLNHFHQHVSTKLSLCLRDFHAENIVWQDQKFGAARIGLLDFQDAILAPVGYDLASFTRDARRDLPPETARHLETQFALRIGADFDAFKRQIALLAIQRNLRILGVFAALISKGKPRYKDFMPRVWNHILTDLDHPLFDDLRVAVLAHVPAPSETEWVTA